MKIISILDGNNTYSVNCYIIKDVMYLGGIRDFGLIYADENAVITPEIISWFANNMRFYDVIRIEHEGQLVWLFSSITHLTKEQAKSIGYFILSKVN